MHEFDSRLEALGFPLAEPVPAAAIYHPVVVAASLAYCSGAVPVSGGELLYQGKVTSGQDLEKAKRSAALCAANNLRQLYGLLGTLARVAHVVKLTGFVNSDPHFTDQHRVIDGASELLKAVFGERGVGARSSIGVATLPLGAMTETELIVALNPA